MVSQKGTANLLHESLTTKSKDTSLKYLQQATIFRVPLFTYRVLFYQEARNRSVSHTVISQSSLILTLAVYFRSFTGQPLQLYYTFSLHPLSGSLPPLPGYNRGLKTHQTERPLPSSVGHSAGRFWNSSPRQTCSSSITMCHNYTDIMKQWWPGDDSHWGWR